MVNATEMAKPFGKRCNDFLSSKSTKELIYSLSVKTGISATELVVVNQGGNNQGTWLHEDLALIFAQWLSPNFYLWCNDRIKELLTTGKSSLQLQTPQTYLEALKALVSSEEEKERLALENEKQQKQITKLQPKAAFADCIMQSNDCISVGEMANVLKQNGLFRRGQNALYEWLRWSGYLLSKGARYNLPSQRSMSLGIMKIAENAQQQKGNVFINRKAVITPYGQRYFISLFSKGKNVGQCAINFTYK